MIARVRRAIPIVVLLGVLVPAALAANGQPQRQYTRADQARARSVAIFASDLGAGWKSQRSAGSDTGSPRCSSYNPDQSDLVETGKYDSPDFTRPDGTFVSSTTGIFRTVAMAQRGYARVAVPAIAACFGELFRKGTGNPKAVKILGSGPVGFPRLGDRSNAYRLSATYATQGTALPVTIDLVLFNRGRIDVAMIFLGVGRPLPASLEHGIAARVAARAK